MGPLPYGTADTHRAMYYGRRNTGRDGAESIGLLCVTLWREGRGGEGEEEGRGGEGRGGGGEGRGGEGKEEEGRGGEGRGGEERGGGRGREGEGRGGEGREGRGGFTFVAIIIEASHSYNSTTTLKCCECGAELFVLLPYLVMSSHLNTRCLVRG